MSWCPECKIEFPEGIIECNNCGNKLVDKLDQSNKSDDLDDSDKLNNSNNLDDSEILENSDKLNKLVKLDYEPVAYVDEEIAQRLVKLLLFSEIPEAIMVYDSLNQNYEVQVNRHNYKKAVDLIRIFKEHEFDENYTEDSEFGTEEEYNDIMVPATNTYVKTSDRYKDNLSSAYTFLICGCGGLIILLLEDLGIIKLWGMLGISKILLNVVVGGLFIGFVIIGFSALRYSKILKQQATEEDEFTSKLIEWLHSNLTIEDIEKSYNTNIPEEMKYFRRVEIIRKKLEEMYSTLDEEFLVKISDDYYYDLFPTL